MSEHLHHHHQSKPTALCAFCGRRRPVDAMDPHWLDGDLVCQDYAVCDATRRHNRTRALNQYAGIVGLAILVIIGLAALVIIQGAG